MELGQKLRVLIGYKGKALCRSREEACTDGPPAVPLSSRLLDQLYKGALAVKRKRLSEHSMYEAKRRLRDLGVIAPAASRRRPRFARIAVSETPKSFPLRARLANGVVLEWREAPQGEALRTLIGALS